MKTTPSMLILLAAILGFCWGAVQAAPDHQDLPPEARQFDFWLGSWDVNLRIRQDDGSWKDSIRSRAKIYPVLDGKAVLELWDAPDIKGFSLRYFDPARKKWHLWLNWPGANRSGSSGLDGSFRHGRGEFFSTSSRPDGTEVMSRYTFSDITATSLRWDDAFSTDGGETWSHNWVMEFTRTGPESPLPEEGGPGHTWHDGSRCDLEPFRRFEVLAGRRSGTAERRLEDGSWSRQPAQLTGYTILDGCSVLVRIQFGEEEHALRQLMLLTWNTYTDLFEASILDNRPETPLAVFFGSEEGDRIILAHKPAADTNPDRRHLWNLDDEVIRLEIQKTEDQGETWQTVVRAGFEQKSD
ncbi:MAG: hypothetical protein O7D35_05380 [Acidobacteria bacterium]|nr:hypothetical protein [Acidobacteriota bacterium]